MTPRQNSISQEPLFHLAEHRDGIRKHVVGAGFKAGECFENWGVGICGTTEDWALHELITIERAKEIFARSIARHEKDMAAAYSSKLLKSTERASDPIWQCLSKLEESEPERYANLRRTLEDSSWAIFESESTTHETTISKKFDNSIEGRCALFLAAAEEYGKCSGFMRESKGRSIPAVVSECGSGWLAVWRLNNLLGLTDASLVWHRREAYSNADFGLALVRRGGANSRRQEEIGIGYKYLYPGLARAYWKFLHNRQLEAIIKAHCALLNLVIPALRESCE